MQNTDKMRQELATLAKSGANIKDDKVEIWTAPYDPRFPNQNQTRYCYQMYVDFQRCKKARGEDYSACQYFQKCYKALCPNGWVEKWDTQVSEDRFPGNI